VRDAANVRRVVGGRQQAHPGIGRDEGKLRVDEGNVAAHVTNLMESVARHNGVVPRVARLARVAIPSTENLVVARCVTTVSVSVGAT